MPDTKTAQPDPMPDFRKGLADAALKVEGKPATPPPPPDDKKESPKTEPDPEPAKQGDVPQPKAVDPASLRFDKGYPTKSEQWKEVKLARERAEARVKELEAQIQSLGDVESLKRLQDEHTALRTTFREVAIERDPEFVAQYTTQRTNFIADAKEAAGEQGAEVAAILERHGASATPYIRELAKKHEWDQYTASQVAASVSALRTLETNRANAIKQARDNWDKYQTEQTAAARRAAEQAQRERQQALEQHLKAVSEVHPFLQKRDGEEAHNAAVDESIAVARRVVQGDLDAEDLARVALMASVYNPTVAWAERLAKENDELRAELKKLGGAAPGPGGGASGLNTTAAGGWEPPKVAKGERGPTTGQAVIAALRKRGL